MAHRSGRGKPVKNFTAAYPLPSTTPLCHPKCHQLKARISQIILSNPQKVGLTRSSATKALALLPRLLCSPGDWPPANIPSHLHQTLMRVFAAACLEKRVSGMRGQAFPEYNEVLAALKHQTPPS